MKTINGKISLDLELEAKNILGTSKKEKEIAQLKKDIAYLEMRKATGTENKFTLIEMLNKKHDTDSFNEQTI